MLYIFFTQILLNTPITKDPKEIFYTIFKDDAVIECFIKHGADTTVVNKVILSMFAMTLDGIVIQYMFIREAIFILHILAK